MLLYFALGAIFLVILSWLLRARVQKRRLPLISNAFELMEREYEQKIELLLDEESVNLEEREAAVEQLSKACYAYIKPTWRQFLHLLRKSPYALGELSYQPLYFPNILTACEGLLAEKDQMVSWSKIDEEILDDALMEAIAADVEIRLVNRNV